MEKIHLYHLWKKKKTKYHHVHVSRDLVILDRSLPFTLCRIDFEKENKKLQRKTINKIIHGVKREQKHYRRHQYFL